jgi:hypothetical protein
LHGKASEVDQELECEMHQTKYKVMIGCDMDLRPMTTTHIVRSCMRNGESRETHLHETTSLNHNLRRIICYIPYSEPVWPKHRNMVRMFWFLNKLRESETFCSVGFESEDCLVLAAACSIYLPDSTFRLPT